MKPNFLNMTFSFQRFTKYFVFLMAFGFLSFPVSSVEADNSLPDLYIKEIKRSYYDENDNMLIKIQVCNGSEDVKSADFQRVPNDENMVLLSNESHPQNHRLYVPLQINEIKSGTCQWDEYLVDLSELKISKSSRISAEIDAKGAVEELNERNNVFVKYIYFNSPDSDLLPDITLENITITPGRRPDVTLEYDSMNRGAASVRNTQKFWISLYIDGEFITHIGGGTNPFPFPPGDKRHQLFWDKIPLSAKEITLIVDEDDNILESNEDNNRFTQYINFDDDDFQPDLEIKEMTLEIENIKNNTIPVKIQICNNDDNTGVFSPTEDMNSSPGIITLFNKTGDTKLSLPLNQNTPLAPGECFLSEHKISLTELNIPTSAYYKIEAEIDPGNIVKETIDRNNRFTVIDYFDFDNTGFEPVGLPDLVFENVVLTKKPDKKYATLSWYIANQGETPVTKPILVGIYKNKELRAYRLHSNSQQFARENIQKAIPFLPNERTYMSTNIFPPFDIEMTLVLDKFEGLIPGHMLPSLSYEHQAIEEANENNNSVTKNLEAIESSTNVIEEDIILEPQDTEEIEKNENVSSEEETNFSPVTLIKRFWKFLTSFID